MCETVAVCHNILHLTTCEMTIFCIWQSDYGTELQGMLKNDGTSTEDTNENCTLEAHSPKAGIPTDVQSERSGGAEK